MIKTLFTSLIMSVLCITASAQTTCVATLNHNGEITTFYNGTALKEAYEKAADGDIINLSAGAFNAVKFNTKKVTIRGAGMIANDNPTVILGDVYIELPETDENSAYTFNMEGIITNYRMYIYNLTNANFTKCHIKNLIYSNTSNPKYGINFLHCILPDASLTNGNPIAVSMTNCYINKPDLTRGDSKSYDFRNCVINLEGQSVKAGNYSNCLFISTNTSNGMENDVFGSGCVSVGGRENFFSTSPSTTNRRFDVGTEIFKEGGDLYELTDENKTAWLGDDGTQVGIYGGSIPFDPLTTNPRITKFNVASKTTVDGKLSVDIEVKAN